MSPYLDTSALVRLYVPEPGSERVARLVRRVGEPIWFSQLHELELVNGLRLKAFGKEATTAAVDATIARVREDLRSGVLVRRAVEWPAVFLQATELAARHSAAVDSGSLDVLHVAAALTDGATRFITTDARQAKLARRAALPTTLLR